MDGVLNERDFFDGNIENTAVPFINYINKNPEQFRTLVLNGANNQTCMDLMFQTISFIFKKATDDDNELLAMCGVTLINHILDSVQGIDGSLPGIIEILIKELFKA